MKMKKNEQGFSLIELTIALVLIGVLFVAVMTGFRAAVVSTGKLRSENIALNLAKERIEFLKQYENTSPSASVWAGSYSKTENGITFNVSSAILSAGQFSCPQVTISGTLQNDPNVVPVRVNVNWSERAKTRNVTMETFYYSAY
jgi:prepilin-type N-terminal cleavage/methylation domain-containing protein